MLFCIKGAVKVPSQTVKIADGGKQSRLAAREEEFDGFLFLPSNAALLSSHSLFTALFAESPKLVLRDASTIIPETTSQSLLLLPESRDGLRWYRQQLF